MAGQFKIVSISAIIAPIKAKHCNLDCHAEKIVILIAMPKKADNRGSNALDWARPRANRAIKDEQIL